MISSHLIQSITSDEIITDSLTVNNVDFGTITTNISDIQTNITNINTEITDINSLISKDTSYNVLVHRLGTSEIRLVNPDGTYSTAIDNNGNLQVKYSILGVDTWFNVANTLVQLEADDTLHSSQISTLNEQYEVEVPALITSEIAAASLVINASIATKETAFYKQDPIYLRPKSGLELLDTLTLKYNSSLTTDPSGNLKVNAIDTSVITSGTLSISRGGTGSNTLTSGQVLIGNGTNALLQTPNLTWDNSNNRLGISNSSPIAPLTLGNASGVCDGYIVLQKNDGAGGNRMYRIGIDASSNLRFGDFGYSNIPGTWQNQFSISYAAPTNSFLLNQYGDIILGNNLYVYGIISGNASRISAINASNVSSGTLAVLQGGTGVTTSTGSGSNVLNTNPTFSGLINVGNGSGLAVPSFGATGGSGDKVILWPGDASHHPYSLGMNGSVMWYSVPSGAYHVFYTNGTNICQISNTGFILNSGNMGIGKSPSVALDVSGNINASSNLQEGGVNLSSKYLLQTGGTLTSNLNVSGYINASSNLQEAGVNIDTKFLSINGGQIYGGLAVNNGNTGAPATGAFGGTGDKFILYPGGTGVNPYSLGINSGTLWYSVPSGAVHNFYVNGTSVLTINSSNTYINDSLTINGATVSYSTLQLATTQSSGSCLRIEGGTSTNVANALSIGGYGKITVDYPSVGGGRLVLDDNGNLSLPRGTLSVAGSTTTNSLTSTTSISTASLTASSSITANTLSATTSISTASLTVSSSITTNTLTVNGGVTCANIKKRVLYNNGTVTPYYDSGYWYASIDFNSWVSIYPSSDNRVLTFWFWSSSSDYGDNTNVFTAKVDLFTSSYASGKYRIYQRYADGNNISITWINYHTIQVRMDNACTFYCTIDFNHY